MHTGVHSVCLGKQRLYPREHGVRPPWNTQPRRLRDSRSGAPIASRKVGNIFDASVGLETKRCLNICFKQSAACIQIYIVIYLNNTINIV